MPGGPLPGGPAPELCRGPPGLHGPGPLHRELGVFLILTVAVASGIVFRIRVEERALVQDLGEPYRAYAVTHTRRVPFVW